MLLAKRNKGGLPIADFDPFGALSLFDELLPSSLLREDRPFSPAMDVSETDKDYKVRLEAPGMEKSDIRIEFDNNILTLSGEKKSVTEETTEKTYRSERRYGSFSRSLRFSGVDGEKIAASYKDGVLEVIVPKSESAQPRKITIE